MILGYICNLHRHTLCMCFDLRQSQRLFTAQRIFTLKNVLCPCKDTQKIMVLLYLYIIWLWGWWLLHIECGFKPWPWEFTRTVLSGLNFSFFPTPKKYRPGTTWCCVGASCVYLCELDNKLPACCVSQLAACSFRLHRLWPWLGVKDKKNSAVRKTVIFYDTSFM